MSKEQWTKGWNFFGHFRHRGCRQFKDRCAQFHPIRSSSLYWFHADIKPVLNPTMKLIRGLERARNLCRFNAVRRISPCFFFLSNAMVATNNYFSFPVRYICNPMFGIFFNSGSISLFDQRQRFIDSDDSLLYSTNEEEELIIIKWKLNIKLNWIGYGICRVWEIKESSAMNEGKFKFDADKVIESFRITEKREYLNKIELT